MAGITHSTPSDGTFSSAGATAWDADHTITETGGASLTIGAISNGQVLARSGTTIIGQAASSNSGPTFPGGIPLTTQKWINASNVSVSTGDTDLYTVPSGKRVLLYAVDLYNASGIGAIAWYPEVKISGTYYRLNTNTSTNNAFLGTVTPGYIAEAGEIIAINTATNNGGVVFINGLEFDNTCKLYSAKLTSLSAGDNTLYTASGVSAIVIPANNPVAVPTILAALGYVNSSGGTRTLIPKVTPSGGSATQIAGSQNVLDANRGNINMLPVLQNGDAIVINTDAATATQFLWANVMEI